MDVGEKRDPGKILLVLAEAQPGGVVEEDAGGLARDPAAGDEGRRVLPEPASNDTSRLQRAEKLSTGSPTAAAPSPQSKSIEGSLRTSAGAPLRPLFVQYSPFQSG